MYNYFTAVLVAGLIFQFGAAGGEAEGGQAAAARAVGPSDPNTTSPKPTSGPDELIIFLLHDEGSAGPCSTKHLVQFIVYNQFISYYPVHIHVIT
jgi:hypothetical protein